MGARKNKGYKRSWKNLLLNKRYQLRFTLFMVGLSALLMAVLGWWVNKEAQKATTIFLNNVQTCPQTPALVSEGGDSGSDVQVDTTDMQPVDEEMVAPPADDESGEPADDEATPEGEGAAAEPSPAKERMPSDVAEPAAADNGESNGAGAAEGAAEGAPEAGGEGERPARVVAVTTSEMTIEKRITKDFVSKAVKAHTCRMQQAAEREALFDGQRLILYVMVIVGLILIIGLTIYGIKMTHRVAGPLFKVTLYFDKMKNGKYDTVYPLRKGDHLGEFYAHFKQAHAGLKKTEEEDVEQLKAVIQAAEAEDLASKSPEIAAALEELRATLKRKEEGLV